MSATESDSLTQNIMDDDDDAAKQSKALYSFFLLINKIRWSFAFQKFPRMAPGMILYFARNPPLDASPISMLIHMNVMMMESTFGLNCIFAPSFLVV
jgi:hypothetical protein